MSDVILGAVIAAVAGLSGALIVGLLETWRENRKYQLEIK
jgi:hypothetical protein